MDGLTIIETILSIIASLVNIIALVFAGLTYMNTYASRLKFTHTIGVSFNTRTNSPVYGVSLTIKNLAVPTTIEEVELSLSHTNNMRVVLFPQISNKEADKGLNQDRCVELKTNSLCCYNFGFSKQQLDYFRKNTDAPNDPVRFIVKTTKKEYVIKSNISINQMCIDANKLLFSEDEETTD